MTIILLSISLAVNFGQWLGLISLVLSGYVLWQIRSLLLLVFAAIVFATVLNRCVRELSQRCGLPRGFAIAIILALLLLLTVCFFWLIVPPFINEFRHLIDLFPLIWEKIRQIVRTINQKEAQWNWLPPLPSLSTLITQIQPISTPLLQSFFAFFSNSFTAILQLLVMGVLTILMLIAPEGYRRAALLFVPSFYRRRVDEILTLSEATISNLMLGIVFNCLFICVLSGLGLWVLQVKLVLVHALLAGVLNFIPNIGPTSSVIFPILVVVLDSPWKILPIVIWYFIVQNVESYWLTPTVMAKQVSLLPAVTLMAQLFFASIFGLGGLLLALPLTAVVKIWVEQILFIDILDPWQRPEQSP